ncbi:NAD(P)/FAD-dependent oxidoreductase [Nocardia sp. NPDC051833]|uniref:flavin monoamine oxidase family protein n=1 Tax=Nocardia sp. NPDC051833 TaxID=3155674 RepID=UPI003417EC4F
MAHGMVREERRDVVVVGAGIAGLMSGTTLSDGADVVVLEASDRAGGRVESVRRGEYWVNVGTQFTEGTGALIDELDKHRIHRGTLAGKKVGLLLNGRMVDTANPIALMFRTRMTFADRVALAKVGARIVSAAVGLDPRFEGRSFYNRIRSALDKKSAAYVLEGVKSPVAHAMVNSWTGQWMGCDPDETAAPQFVISMSVALADPGKVPNFSLPEGGNQTLTDILAEGLGDRLRLGASVDSVERKGDEVLVRYTDAEGAAQIHAKRVIIAVPADIAARIVSGLPEDYRAALGAIGYGRYVVVGYFTEEEGPSRWDDYYGVSTPLLEFQAVFNHSAAQRGSGPRNPGGALACFAGGSKADALFELSDDDIADRFSRDLLSIYPELDGKLGTPIVRRHHRVVPYWGPGQKKSLATLQQPLGPLWFAGDYALDMPSLADAAASGERAAKAVLGDLAG